MNIVYSPVAAHCIQNDFLRRFSGTQKPEQKKTTAACLKKFQAWEGVSYNEYQ